MKNRFTATLLAFTLALFVAIPAHASTQFGVEGNSPASQQLPNFIPEGAVAMSDNEMSEVRGEFIPLLAYYAVVYGVPYSVAFAAMLSRSGVPLIRIAFDAAAEWRSQ